MTEWYPKEWRALVARRSGEWDEKYESLRVAMRAALRAAKPCSASSIAREEDVCIPTLRKASRELYVDLVTRYRRWLSERPDVGPS
ncbi:MAG: hypothetical protein OXU81_11210 [Gammaproteobacteria bacterium]|nr:hypothetical protein [Gammaproteobacteria bacterium]